jgi:hypothetical protein
MLEAAQKISTIRALVLRMGEKKKEELQGERRLDPLIAKGNIIIEPP